MFFDFLKDVGNYETRKLGRETINGLDVSTAFTSDEGYETAIIDANGVHPVERYVSKEDATAGHIKWLKDAETLTTITKLGWQGLVDPTTVLLERKA